ncbi:MAG: hypothetical protein J1D87_11775, partial [Lachnospiraceae bacterium]|nr:hypothetical protein [Lachnospiraceae bacterium]
SQLTICAIRLSGIATNFNLSNAPMSIFYHKTPQYDTRMTCNSPQYLLQFKNAGRNILMTPVSVNEITIGQSKWESLKPTNWYLNI